MRRLRTPVFYGVPASRIDEVLDRLADLGRLPPRCLVFSSSTSLLTTLSEQWSGRVEIVVVLVPESVGDVLGFLEAIAISEGIESTELILVCQRSRSTDSVRDPWPTPIIGDSDARQLTDQLSGWLPLP